MKKVASPFPTLWTLLVPLLSMGFAWYASPGLFSLPVATPSQPALEQFQLHLPLVLNGVQVDRASSIWAHDEPPAPHEIGLFRHRFSLDAPVNHPELLIFADTRYEVWIDGEWLGRGPARFSRETREYDRYILDTLSPGEHVVAVLVQWAPNWRRSESITPFLDLAIHDSDSGALIVQSSSAWKVQLSDAWEQGAAPVHAWGLIGPTELLDLRRLPADWVEPDFPDQEWPSAVVKLIPEANQFSRSIPTLAQVPIKPLLLESGRLAPDEWMVELLPSSRVTEQVTFDVTEPVTVTVRMVEIPEKRRGATVLPLVESTELDGSPLEWESDEAAHPDIRSTSSWLEPGTHTLSFSALPPEGATLALSKEGIDLPEPPFSQGVHAGRRLLLARMQEEAGVVAHSEGERLDISFTGPPAYLVLDLGRVVHGRFVAEVSGGAGTLVDMGWDERLWQNGRPLPYPGSLHPEWNQTDSWILDGSTRSLTTLDARAGRYLILAKWGDQPLELRNVRVLEERYPVIKQGYFASLNPRFNRIWQVGVDTLYSNMTDAYADPWRERGQWWGDAYVADHVNQVAFGELQLLRRGLWFMAEAINDEGRHTALAPHGHGIYIHDYGLLWVQSLHDYWRQSGDADLIQELFPALVRFMEYLEGHENERTGLLLFGEGEEKHWSRTSLIDWAGEESRYGQSTALNAMYVGTLRAGAELADVVGDADLAVRWSRRAEAVKEATNRLLYRPDEGRYMSALYKGEYITPTVHAQAWPLAYGLTPASETQRVADALLELLSSDPARPNVEIYGMFWVLEGLGRADRHAEALDLIDLYYGRLLDLGATTWWEGFNAHRSYTSALSHGWGGSPTWFLSTYILGARRTAPDRWELRPSPAGLKEVEGALPLQSGALEVRWRYRSCERIELEVRAPSGTSGTVRIPFPDPELSIVVNGQAMWASEQPQAENVEGERGGVTLLLEEGRHSVEIQRSCSTLYLPALQR